MNTTKKELNAIKKLVIAEDKKNSEYSINYDYFVVELFYYENTKKISNDWVYTFANASEAFDRCKTQTDMISTNIKKRHVVALVSKDFKDEYRVVKLTAQNKQETIIL